MFRLLARTSERWYSASFDLPHCAYSILRCVSGRLPLLTLLYINVADCRCLLPERDNDGYGMPWEMFSSAPLLRSIKVDGYDPDMFNFDWDEVNEVSVNPLQGHHCLELLSNWPELTRCTFERIQADSEVGPQQPVLASELVFLSLQVDEDQFQSGFDPLAYILNALTTPALRELEIKASESIITTVPSLNLQSVLSRSTYSLQRLVLHGFFCNAGLLLSCFNIIAMRNDLKDRHKGREDANAR